jgi:predicted Rossmann fold flavoprotein
MPQTQRRSVVITGAGAAGFFSALTCAETNPDCQVTILEQSPQVLSKVKVSGGGRCNVTHHCFDPKQLLTYYPRGHRELIGPFHHWQPHDTITWFESRGVPLKTESDGRMFPTTDSSQTIIDCFIRQAQKLNVTIKTNCKLKSVLRQQDGRFDLELGDGHYLNADALLLATGGTRAAHGAKIAASLGHELIPPVPSLFSLRIKDPRLKGLAGLSKEKVQVHFGTPENRFTQNGPLLITHEGLSGPAILKLSAWGARSFAQSDYNGTLLVDWTAGEKTSQLRELFTRARQETGRRQLSSQAILDLPQRLWERLLEHAEIPPDRRWLELRKKEEEALLQTLTQSRFLVEGKSMNKEEFVTCGGIPTKEVDFRTMESKCCPGLYFAGEILNLDGVTGGFNFQAAWTTGYLAGRAMAQPSTTNP